jgi:aspartate racemase
LHIAECVAEAAQQSGYAKVGVLGTKYLMTGPVYPDTLTRYEIEWAIPDEPTRERIDTIIFSELVNGVFREKSRRYFNEIIDGLRDRGCDAVVLGCTEIPLIVDPADCPLPTLDSTRLLARAALQAAVGG